MNHNCSQFNAKMETNAQTMNTTNERQLELYGLSKKFFNLFLILLSGYALGWMGFSISWILIFVFIWTLRYKYFKENSDKVNLQRSIASNEKLAITCAMQDLPSWVYFPVIDLKYLYSYYQHLFSFITNI